MQDPKKNMKKRRRCAARLKASRGIICTEEPQKNLIICNAGMNTGLEKDDIIQIIDDLCLNIPVPRFIAEKGESYSFLLFPDVSSATEFFTACDGRVALGVEPALVISYVEGVPEGETICEFENPEGLTILEAFITEDEEKVLLKYFDWNDDSSNLKNRQVRHYGYAFRYGSNDVDLDSPLPQKIPEQCSFLFKRLKEQGFDLGVPDQLTLNKYYPGQGIPSHVDKHSPFGETILSLSLGSDVVMDWKHPTGKHVPVKVNARSMLLMQDEARYGWTHGIHSRTWDPIIEYRVSSETNRPIKVVTLETVKRKTRISLTFRWTRSGRCECKYKTLCDSVDRSGDYAEEVARNLEDLHVHQVYDRISFHFSKTRAKPWPKVVQFMENLKPGSVVIDLGCGNGKNVLERNDLVQIAADTCEGLLWECKYNIAATAGADCVRLDALAANLRDACADAIICIAVIHHFSNKTRRKQAVETIARLLCPGGRALITVWSKDQADSNYLLKTKEESIEEDLRSVGEVVLPVHENRTEFQHNDLLVPWKLRFNAKGAEIPKRTEETFLRYYHVFDENEFENLCREIPGICVENSVFDEGNYCVTIRKC